MEPEPEPQDAEPALYNGNFLVVTTAISPHADPSTFVEEGVQANAEFLTNYPHLDVLAGPNPRRYVVYTPTASGTGTGEEQPKKKKKAKLEAATKPKAEGRTADDLMQVTTPNRHAEIMLGVESALRKLCEEHDEYPQRLLGGLHMHEVQVSKRLASADDGRPPSAPMYTERPPREHQIETKGRRNVWIHVTHRDDVACPPSGGSRLQFPAEKFGFDLADVRHHHSQTDTARQTAPGIPWVASDGDLSKPIAGPAKDGGVKQPSHSRRFLDHLKRHSDLVAEDKMMQQGGAAVGLEPLTPSQVDAQRQLKEIYADTDTVSAAGSGQPPNVKLWDVKVQVHAEPEPEPEAKRYFVGTMVYCHDSPYHLLELDSGGEETAFSLTYFR